MHVRSVVETGDAPRRGASLIENEFAVAVRPHVRSALSLAQRILGCPGLAWDAVQESLVTLWTEPSRPPELGAWLHRTVLHRSLHALRSRRRREAHEQACARCFAPRAEGPLRLFESDEIGARLNAAIASLPPEYRAVIERREIDGEDYEAIAAALDVPLGTVRSRLHRARALLRRSLGEVGPHPVRHVARPRRSS